MRTILTFIGLAVPAVLSAQWLHQENGGAFDDNPLQIAMTANGNLAFGARCHDETDLELVFITNDSSFKDEDYELANVTSPKLLVRVDENEPYSLAAELFDSDGTIGVVSPVEPELLKEIASANARVAVALDLLGDTYSETDFNVSGSTAATNTLAENCKIEFETST